MNIRQLDNAAFRKECERIEKEQRKKNAWAAFFILLAIIIVQILIGMAGLPIHWGPI